MDIFQEPRQHFTRDYLVCLQREKENSLSRRFLTCTPTCQVAVSGYIELQYPLDYSVAVFRVI